MKPGVVKRPEIRSMRFVLNSPHYTSFFAIFWMNFGKIYKKSENNRLIRKKSNVCPLHVRLLYSIEMM